MCKVQGVMESILPVSFIGFFCVVCLAFVLRVPGTATEAFATEFSLAALMDGTYQSEMAEWMTDGFPGAAFFTECYTQFKYSVMKELSGGYVLGKDGYMFAGEPSKNYVTGERKTYTQETVESYEAYAKKIKEMQDVLEGCGKEFYLMVNPVKAQICTEDLPASYQFLASQYATGDGATSITLFEDALEKYGVHYFDTTETMQEIGESGTARTFRSTAHHWTIDAAALSLNALFEAVSDTYPAESFPAIQITGSTDTVFGTDLDIYNLQKLFFGKKDESYTTPVISYDAMSEENLFLFGTSYGVEIQAALYQEAGNRAFNCFTYYHYFTHKWVNDSNGTEHTQYNETADVTSGDEMIQEIKDSDIVLMEQQTMSGVMETHDTWLSYVLEHQEALTED